MIRERVSQHRVIGQENKVKRLVCEMKRYNRHGKIASSLTFYDPLIHIVIAELLLSTLSKNS